NRSSVPAIAVVTSSSRDTSAVNASAVPPRPRSSSTAVAFTSAFRPQTATEAPAPTRPRAMPRPIPRLPPVTTTTLPVRSRPGPPEAAPACAGVLDWVMSGLRPHLEEHLAAHGPGLQLLDGLAGLLQRQGRVDDGIQLPGDEVVPQRLPLGCDEAGILRERGTPAHTGHTHVVEQEAVDLDLGDLAGGEAQDQSGAEPGQAAQRVREAVAVGRVAHRIRDEVDAVG